MSPILNPDLGDLRGISRSRGSLAYRPSVDACEALLGSCRPPEDGEDGSTLSSDAILPRIAIKRGHFADLERESADFGPKMAVFCRFLLSREVILTDSLSSEAILLSNESIFAAPATLSREVILPCLCAVPFSPERPDER
jgi:hypothetical protein